MEHSLTIGSMTALFGALVVLAALPSTSVLAVSARAAASGFVQGVWTAVGIVVGDIVFIGIAILGLAVLVEILGDGFVVVKYLGGAWLIWLGIDLWRSRSGGAAAGKVTETTWLSSFMTGLLITLADQKAILFYLGFFPAFVDLSALSALDAVIVITLAVVAVGGVKLAYAWLAHRGGTLIAGRARGVLSGIAAAVLVGVGVFLIVDPAGF